jgi:hypothetical protein
MSTTPILTSQSRVFLIEGRARADHKPSYESCMRMTGLSQGFGDIEKVECPDPYRYGVFIEVAQIKGANERVTTSVEGRFMLDIKSALMDLARKGCSSDIQLHVGKCQNASIFEVFSKAIILEDASITNYGTDDLGALESGDNAAVNETADISAKEVYEVTPITYGAKAGSLLLNEAVDVIICDTASCGDCEDSSSGCDKIYAITNAAAGGSPSTLPDILYSPDKGITWYSWDINGLSLTNDADRIACMGNYVIVTSTDAKGLVYTLKSYFDSLVAPTWSLITSGYASGYPKCIYSDGNIAFIGGTAGYIYYIEDPSEAPVALDTGTLFFTTWNDIHGIGSDFVVVVGDNGAIAYTENGTTFSAITTSPVGIGTNLTAVWVKSESEWWIGTSTGHVYYTLNGGATWTEKAFSGSGAGVVYDIKFSTDSVGYIAHASASPKGRILRTINGGYSWTITPEVSGSTIPANDRINAVAVCAEDPNFVVAVGLDDTTTDGVILVGS